MTTITTTCNAKEEISEALVGVALMAGELTGMAANRQIIIRPGLDLIRSEVMPYLRQPEWAELMDFKLEENAKGSKMIRMGEYPGPLLSVLRPLFFHAGEEQQVPFQIFVCLADEL